MANLINENQEPKIEEMGTLSTFLQPARQMVQSTIRSIESNKLLAEKLDEAAKMTQMKKEQLVGGALALIFVISVIFSGLKLLISIVAWLYPLYRSGQAIKAQDAKESERWLIYWIVFAGVSTFFAYIGDIFLYWVPMYEFTQVGLYIFLWHDITDGATTLFNRYIRTLIERKSQ